MIFSISLLSWLGMCILGYANGRERLGFANVGTSFLTSSDIPNIGTSKWFLIAMIRAVIFFIACVQLLYYYGILQWFVVKFAKFFFWAMKVSGAEVVYAAASPSIGQGESTVLIKPSILNLSLGLCSANLLCDLACKYPYAYMPPENVSRHQSPPYSNEL
jgi:nucleoside permease NupC